MISLKHNFQSEKPDGGDSTIIQPSYWNDEHVLEQATQRILGRLTASTGATEELTAAQVLAFIGYPPNFLTGLTLSNNGSDATNDIDIAAGACRAAASSSVVANMDLGSTLTKRLDASWAVGSGNGGLDTGSIADGTYHVHLIRRSDTGVVDALFSTSATAPTMPADYDSFRRIGSIVRSSSAIVVFRQFGDHFNRAELTLSTGTSNKSSALTVVGVPTGIVVKPILRIVNVNSGGFTSIRLGDAAAGSANILTSLSDASNVQDVIYPFVHTNTSGQIYHSITIDSGSALATNLNTIGWIDRRGQDGGT